MSDSEALWSVGLVVRHRRFQYRGVIFDVDPVFSGSEEWYDAVARSRPPKDRPWYHVLVDEHEHTTYVAERHLEADPSGERIRHPLLSDLFDSFDAGVYRRSNAFN